MINNKLKFALRTAVLIEKQSLDFYVYAAKMVNNSKTREVFRQLASEEAEHLEVFHRLYREYKFGNLNNLINLPVNLDTPNYRSLLKSIHANTQEKEALEISLREEQACVTLYSDLISSFNDSDVRHVFDQALRETSIHCKIIQTEYMRVRSLHETLECVQEPHNLIIINPEKENVGFSRKLVGKNQLFLTVPGPKAEM